jgi:hypothetical protein
MTPRCRRRILAAALQVLLALPAGSALAASSILTEAQAGFSLRARVLGYGTFIDLVPSNLNPGNLLAYPRYRASFDLRPDLDWTLRRVDLSISPRAELRWQRFEDGWRRGTSGSTDSLYVNAWRATLRLGETVFLSYGRENVQWGPSYLLSPSNPFSRSNGQSNPRIEEPGMEYGRAVWIPARRAALTLLANTGQGRLETFRTFSRRYALKADYTGDGMYAAAIVSMAEGDQAHVTKGGYAGWTLSDAVLVHAEASVRRGLDEGALLAGGTYTFGGGAFAVVEVFHDGQGCDADRIEDCFLPPSGVSDPADVLWRRNYLMLQLTHPRLRDRIHLTARWVHDLDDGSSRAIGIYEHELGARYQVFVIGAADLGGAADEFGSVIATAVMAGVGWTY